MKVKFAVQDRAKMTADMRAYMDLTVYQLLGTVEETTSDAELLAEGVAWVVAADCRQTSLPTAADASAEQALKDAMEIWWVTLPLGRMKWFTGYPTSDPNVWLLQASSGAGEDHASGCIVRRLT